MNGHSGVISDIPSFLRTKASDQWMREYRKKNVTIKLKICLSEAAKLWKLAS